MKIKKVLKFVIPIVVIAGVIVSIIVFNKKDNTVPQIAEKDYGTLTADELIEKNVKDPKNISEEELETLLSTLSYVKITDDLELEDNITMRALMDLDHQKAKFPDSQKIINALINDDSPQVRGYAVGLTTSLEGVSEENIRLLKKVIKKEKDTYVLKCAIDALAYDTAKDKDISEFLVRMAKNENAKIRLHAAYALGNKNSIGADGAVDAIISLMNDSDSDVRKAAYKFCGELQDEKVIEPVVKMLSDEKSADYHVYGIMGLCAMWYDYPDHSSVCEKAYDATLNYYRTVKHTDKTPSEDAIGAFARKNSDTFDEWKKKASYYDVKEIIDVMTELVKSADLSWDSRTAAIGVIALHGTKADLEALGKVIDSLKDDQAPFVKGEYEKILKSV